MMIYFPINVYTTENISTIHRCGCHAKMKFLILFFLNCIFNKRTFFSQIELIDDFEILFRDIEEVRNIFNQEFPENF